MLRQVFDSFEITTQPRSFHELTPRVTECVRQSGIRDGLLTLYLEHTSASLLIQENADPEVRRDLERFFSRLVPDGDRLFVHTAEGPDDMPAHVRTALTSVCLSVPVRGATLGLGTWQGIFLWEQRTHRHRRTISWHLIGE